MSNDARYWAYRLLFAGILCIDAFLLASMAGEAMSSEGNVAPWAVAFFVSIVVSIPLGFRLQLAKDRRWQNSQRDQQQIVVETLAALAKQNRQKKK